MSSSIQLTSEINDPQTQFHNGIKMIISAYETQASFLSNELSQLRTELKDKDIKLTKLESLCSSLMEDKTKYEFQLSTLSSTNKHLKQQISFLQSQLNNNNMYSNDHSFPLHHQVKSNSKTHILNGTNINDFTPFSKETIGTSNKNNINYNNEKRNMLYKRNANDTIKENDLLTKTQIALQNKRIPIERNNIMEGSYKQNIENGSCESDDDNSEDIISNMDYDNKRNNEHKKKSNSDFFKLCRDALSVDEYSEMIDVIHLYNSHQFDKEETYEKIGHILSNGNHINLLSDFELLFN